MLLAEFEGHHHAIKLKKKHYSEITIPFPLNIDIHSFELREVVNVSRTIIKRLSSR